MRSRVLKLLHPEHSRLHPKYGPFTAQYSSNKQHKFAVFNCKDKRALVCETDTFLLDPCCKNFDLTDNKTYFTLCNWDPGTVWSQAQSAVARQKAGFGKSSGPYTLSYNKSNPPSITIHSIKGGRHTFKCNPNTNPPDKTKTITEASTPRHNRFSILAEDDNVLEDNTGNTSMNGKHTLLIPQEPTISHHKRLRQLSEHPSIDIPLQRATQTQPAGSSPIESSPPKPDATENTVNTKSKDNEDNTHSSMSSTLSPTDDMSISTVPKQFTISAHTPDGNASDSSKDSERSHPLSTRYPTTSEPQPHSQPHSDKPTQNSNQTTSTVQDGPTTPLLLSQGHQFHLSVEIQLQPNKDHLDVMLYETREILRYIQQVDPTAKFLSKSSSSCPTPPPPLVRPDDINSPQNYITSTKWFHTTSK